MYKERTPTILSWAEEDRPREKMMTWGKNAITNVELLSIIIGRRCARENACLKEGQAVTDTERGKMTTLRWAPAMSYR